MKFAEVHGASIASSQINGEIILSDGQRCTYIGSMPKINLLAISATKQIRPWLVRAIKIGSYTIKLNQGYNIISYYKDPWKPTRIP